MVSSRERLPHSKIFKNNYAYVSNKRNNDDVFIRTTTCKSNQNCRTHRHGRSKSREEAWKRPTTTPKYKRGYDNKRVNKALKHAAAKGKGKEEGAEQKTYQIRLDGQMAP